MTEEWLQQNALWIIVDPWHKHPKVWKGCPNVDEINAITANRIAAYLPEIKHVCIAMGDKLDNKTLIVAQQFMHLYNIQYKTMKLVYLMEKNNLKDIVYCGFHYGRCIINKPIGAKIMSKYFKTWVKKDLCCFIADENLPSIEYADKITEKYATII
jgi:hypothetical protein